MANKDGTWLREISPCCCLTRAGKIRQLLLNKIYIPFLPPLYYYNGGVGIVGRTLDLRGRREMQLQARGARTLLRMRARPRSRATSSPPSATKTIAVRGALPLIYCVSQHNHNGKTSHHYLFFYVTVVVVEGFPWPRKRFRFFQILLIQRNNDAFKYCALLRIETISSKEEKTL